MQWKNEGSENPIQNLLHSGFEMGDELTIPLPLVLTAAGTIITNLANRRLERSLEELREKRDEAIIRALLAELVSTNQDFELPKKRSKYITKGDFKDAVGSFPFGYTYRGSRYVHIGAVHAYGGTLLDEMHRAEQAVCATVMKREDVVYNVIRFDAKDNAIELWDVDKFEIEGLSSVRCSHRIQRRIRRVKTKEYDEQILRPLVLHRSSLVVPTHESHSELESFDRAFKMCGLHKYKPKTVGELEAALKDKGLAIEGNSLVTTRPRRRGERGFRPERIVLNPIEGQAPIFALGTPLRQTTEHSDKGVSLPLHWALSQGLVNKSALDLGCGEGGDIEVLQALGFKARGFDPEYERFDRPVPVRTKFHYLQSVFVLDFVRAQERVSILKTLVKSSRRDGIIMIAVRTREYVRYLGRVNKWTKENRGYVDPDSTFHEGFTQDEIVESVEKHKVNLVHIEETEKYFIIVLRRR